MITHSHQIITIGRRKTSVARVVLKPGSGTITVNRRALEHYFPVDTMRSEVLLPFAVTVTVGQYDVVAKARGGGEARNLPRARRAQRGPPVEAARRQPDDARPEDGGAKEVRSKEGAQEVPVLEALAVINHTL